MKRLNSNAAILIGVAVVALTFICLRVTYSPKPPNYSWGMFYYMPYDNDLGYTFEPAIEQIVEATPN